MATVQLLDCTLRDGGYCNEWKFGFHNIVTIIDNLVQAGTEIIECGYLHEKVEGDSDRSLFCQISDLEKVLPSSKGESKVVCMINFGQYNIDNLPERSKTSIDGIRLAFHKKDREKALEECKKIKEKGYLLFMQPMVTLNYSDVEFIQLIEDANIVEPYAFYIVDSFGSMKQKQLLHLFYMVEKNLSDSVIIGFHGHNNLQLALSNAQVLTGMQTNRELLIDSSVFGMGRGAGNLNTELFMEHLNCSCGKSYKIDFVLKTIDEILNRFYEENYWGYSLANYLSGTYNIHPNYASFLEEKNKLTLQNISDIFALMDSDKKWEFDKEYIKDIYLEYLGKGLEDSDKLIKSWQGKEILIIGPGRSAEVEREKVCQFAREHSVIAFSLNFIYSYLDVDYIFVSNVRRYHEMKQKPYQKLIVTSNIDDSKVQHRLDYTMLMNDFELIADNAGMMLLKYLVDSKAKKIWLAGIDGYSYNMDDNYINNDMTINIRKCDIKQMNSEMKKLISNLSEYAEIEFLTTSILQ
ncbi:MAG: aldolase catalytic domain-containing protein [Lachnospiraceae bacterium]|nr:aldolase catalytic domain-containing protein [Lachnospiraceae bacterium]